MKKEKIFVPTEVVRLTPEEAKRLLEEGIGLRKALEPQLEKMTRLTAEDWNFRVK